MEILEGEALAELLLEKYSRSPRGWSFVVAPSKSSGFFDAMVSSGKQSWQLKLDSIFKPNPLVLGAQTDLDQDRLGSMSPLTFGYRELDPGAVLRALRRSYTSGEEQHPDLSLGLDLSPILRSEPTVPKPGRTYAQGPFVFSHENVVKLTGGAETVDERLSSEMLRLFRKRYSGYR